MNEDDNIKEIEEVKPLMKYLSIEQARLIWESIFFLFFFINSTYALWFFVPYSFFLKILITIISLIIVYDIFKNFIYVRWILLKEEE